LALSISTGTHHYDTAPELKDLSYSQYLHYVSQTNYKNLWKEAQKRFPETCRPSALNRSHPRQQKTSESRDVLRSLLCSAFNSPVISLVDNSVLHSKSGAVQESYIASAVALFESSTHFLAITEHSAHNVQQCLSLSPTLLSPSSVRPMFVLYQMLHAVREMQDRSLRLEGVSWQHVCIRQDLTIKVLPSFASSLSPVEIVTTPQPSSKEAHLQELTMSWVRGCLSNYEYLLALNDLAGRQIENPYNHPVLPWISDLSSPFGAWRDLAKSKFRLNKGDRQLDLTFDPADAGKSDDGSMSPASPQQMVARHHVTDVLSEITYYVYKARRTAKSVLCRFVRPQWKPLEYPSSIERMQQWTPDECIPQFFSDPTIFKVGFNFLNKAAHTFLIC